MTPEKLTLLLTYRANQSGSFFSASINDYMCKRRIEMAITAQSVLSNELLARFAERAPLYEAR